MIFFSLAFLPELASGLSLSSPDRDLRSRTTRGILLQAKNPYPVCADFTRSFRFYSFQAPFISFSSPPKWGEKPLR